MASGQSTVKLPKVRDHHCVRDHSRDFGNFSQGWKMKQINHYEFSGGLLDRFKKK